MDAMEKVSLFGWSGVALFATVIGSAPIALAQPLVPIASLDPPALASDVGISVAPIFDNGALEIDQPNMVLPENFSSEGLYSYIDPNGNAATFSGVLSGPMFPIIGSPASSSSSGTITFTGINSYTGVTYIQPGATLALAGQGSIAASSGVIASGTFDISRASGGVSVFGLSSYPNVDTGMVNLGGNTLTIAFIGTYDGGIEGTGGLTVASGASQTLTGVGSYSGATTIDLGGTLDLGGVAVAGSSNVVDNGVISILPDQSGPVTPANFYATVSSLSGSGVLNVVNFAEGVPHGIPDFTLTHADGTFSGEIDGALHLVIAGGTETLTGLNRYTGGTTIEGGGTLAVSTLLGLGGELAPLTLNDGTLRTTTDTSSGVAQPIVLGPGGGTIDPGGAQNTLALVNSISGPGGLTVPEGVLVIVPSAMASTSYTGLTSIASGADLVVTRMNGIATSSGVVDNGTLDLGEQDYSSEAISSLSGNGSVLIGATDLLLTNAAGTFSGTISGTAGVAITGGTQALTGTNTYAGGTTISGGATLAVNSDAALGAPAGGITFNDGTLRALADFTSLRPITVLAGGGTVDNNGYAVTLDGPLTLDGPFAFIGDGRSTFTGSLNDAGPLTISQGLFSDDGSVTAPEVIVGPGGILHGTGVVNAPTLVDGRLAPGNSPGTLTFTAPVTLAPGSTSEFDIDGTGTGTGAGNYSRVIVTGVGNTYAAGGTLLPLLRGITGSASNTYTPPLGQAFQIVSAQGGVTGSYAALTQPAGLQIGTRFDVAYAPDTVTLFVTPAHYGNLQPLGVSETTDQAAAGAALDAVRPGAGLRLTPTQSEVFSPLYGLPLNAIAPALDQMGPTIYGDSLMAAGAGWHAMADAISGRLSDNGAVEAAQLPGGITTWVSGLGNFQSLGSDGAPGFSDTLGGGVAGIDVALPRGITAGLAAGGGALTVSSADGASATGNRPRSRSTRGCVAVLGSSMGKATTRTGG